MRCVVGGTVRRLVPRSYPLTPCATTYAGVSTIAATTRCTRSSRRRASTYPSRRRHDRHNNKHSSSSSSAAAAAASNTSRDHDRRLFLSTSVTEPFSVPLTLADVQLRNEQLPFAYVYKKTLDADRLIASFREVLRRYPILGAKVDFAPGKVPTLECNANDTVPMSFGTVGMTLEEWSVEKKSGRMQHTNWRGGGDAPLLSPLFDDLCSTRWITNDANDAGDDEDVDADGKKRRSNDNVATVRITNFEGGGTAVGINMSHLLGDASSCFRIAQVWGREMRGKNHPMGASNNRAEATLTGMVSPEMAGLLNLDAAAAAAELKGGGTAATVTPGFDFLSGIRDFFFEGTSLLHEDDNDASTGCGDTDDRHEYVRLQFSPELLQALKAYGLAHCASLKEITQAELLDGTCFVSTNDMVTAFGWMLKRRISKKPGWNISMVVNLRNKGGIDEFSCVKDMDGANGVFGNALTNIVAKLPPSKQRTTCDLSSDRLTNGSMTEVGAAAVAIRQALTENTSDIPDLLSLSRLGKASQAADQSSCFSSTSWREFPLWDISFSDDDNSDDDANLLSCLDWFYGRPSHPLPIGDTYASVIVPTENGGCTYKLLAPTRQVQSILELHEDLASQFLAWASEQDASSKV